MKIFCENCGKSFKAQRDNTAVVEKTNRCRKIFTVMFACPECGQEEKYTYSYRPKNNRGDYF
jgi:RNase P subunit RPR2